MTKPKKMDWFACYPDKWLGALQDMAPEDGYSYLVICFRIYEHHGPISDSVQSLARRIGFRPSKIERIIDRLLANGKLFRTENGSLMNKFAEQEIADGIGVRAFRRRQNSTESRSNLYRNCDESFEKNQEIQASSSLPRPIPNQKKERKRESLPALWHPGDHAVRYAVSKGFAGDRLQPIIRNFVHWHRARDVCLANFDDEFIRWIDREVGFERQRQRNGGEHGQRGSRALQDDRLSVGKAAQRLAEQLTEGGQFPPRPRLVPDESPPDRRLLPSR